jgi:tape measure domain-containing protein
MANNLDLKIRINGEDNTGTAFGKTRAGITSISEQLSAMQTRMQQLVALKIGDIIGGQLGKIIQTADGFKTLQARLKLVSDSTAEYNIAQQAVFDIAQRTRASLEGTANIYGKLETAIKQLGGTQNDALRVTETLNQAIALTSQGAAQDEAAILQFSQALGSGVLRGDEFNSVMENSPGLAQALANGLQVPITALRGMAEAGELTADRIINALGKAAPEVAKQFAQLPTTVGQAFTQLQNEFTRYIGEADAASGFTNKLAAAIQFAAQNIGPLSSTVGGLAVIYGVTLLQGLVKSAAAMLDNAAAARQKAAAEQTARAAALELLQTELQVAKVRVTTTQQLIEEARLQQALAVTDTQRAASIKLVEKAMLDYHAAVNLVNGKEAALAAATEKKAVAMSVVTRIAGALTKILTVLIYLDIAKMFAEWALKIDAFRAISLRVQEGLVILLTGFQALANGGMNFDERIKQIKGIHDEFTKLIENGPAKLATEEKKSNAEGEKTIQLQTQQAASIKNLVDSYKALSDSAKNAADQQLAAVDIKQTQSIRTVETTVTDAGGVDRSAERERAITQVLAQAAQDRSRILQKSAQERLQLIDQAHNKEVQSAKAAQSDTAKVDKEWVDSKYKVLKDWQTSTAKTIDELIALEKKHRDAAIQADTDIANHKRDTAKTVADLQGKNDVNNAAELSRLQTDTYTQKRGVTDALKTGDTEKALQAAKQIEQAYTDIAQKAKGLFDQGIIDQTTLDSAIYDFQNAAKQVDQIAAQQGDQQKKAAEDVAGEIAKQQATLGDVNGRLDALIEKAKQTLTINVDKSAIDAAKAAIDAIPSEKTVTIKTINEAGNPVTADQASPAQTDAQNMPGYADGTRLAGFGGGDQLPALLEPGEGVVNKFGMRALDTTFGPGFFDGINSGGNPVELLRQKFKGARLADGGRISVNMPSINPGSIHSANGTPINIHLPDGQKFGPFTGSGDSVSALESALHNEVLKRGRRVL